VSVLDHFGIIAPFYDMVFGRNSKIDWVAVLAVAPGLRILDVAGGTGRVVADFPTRGCQAVVVDESFGMLQQSKKKRGIQSVCARAEHLPFPASIFDRVIMVDAMHHLADQVQSAAEMIRVLRSEGILVLQEPDIRKLAIKFVALFEKILMMRTHFLNAEQITKLFDVPDRQIEINRQDWAILISVRRKLRKANSQ